MRWRVPNTPALDALLRSLSAGGSHSLPQIAELHGNLLAGGRLAGAGPVDGNRFLVVKLLQLYADAGDLPSALRLFGALPFPPSVFAWTPLLALLSRSPALRPRCLWIYAAMRSAAVAPDAYVFPPVLRSSVISAVTVAAVHADAIKFASDGPIPVRNALIDAYAKSSDISAARRAFDETDGPDLVSWNSILAAYAGSGSIDSAVDVFNLMRSNGCDPDLVTWNTLLDGYCRSGRCDEAVRIVDRMLNPNVVSWTTLISGYSRSGNQEAALGIFRRMMSTGDAPPDQDTLSCIVSCCRHVAGLAGGRSIHAYGLKTLTADVFYCSAGAALVTMYASWDKISTAQRIFGLMDPTDAVTWNAVILGFAHSGLDEVALQYFRDMQSRGIGCDPTTVATVLPVCSNLKHGKEVHGHVIKRYNGIATTVWNAIINMYSRSGCIRIADSVFSGMDARDAVSWNTMIGAFGSHGLGDQAIGLVRGMLKGLGPRPNGVTFINALMACSHCGLVDEGLELFERLGQDFGLVPAMGQYACVVDMLARAGRFEEAVEFIGRMPVQPDPSVWGAVLAACRTHQNVEFGRLAFEQLVELEPKNPGNYVTMSNIYVRGGRWGDAKMVRMMMEKRELVKPSGYSWIEIAQ